MEHIAYSDRKTHINNNDCTVHEFPSPTADLDAAIVDLDGRYPETGWAINKECRALLYVIAKRGRVVPHPSTNNQAIDVSAGSQVHIEPNEAYALEGSMRLLFVSTPKWSPDQAEHIE